MTQEQLAVLLQQLISEWESECVEFKEANNNFKTDEIGEYFSALSNEANLKGRNTGWLVFGVHNKTRLVVGTPYRTEMDRLHSLKHQIASDTEPSTSFREIHELLLTEGRVVLFEIPAAPRGMPIAWKTHYYGRDGESLSGLSVEELDRIRNQSLYEDWSAVVHKGATLGDLDSDAIAKARDIFLGKYRDRIPEETIKSWNDETFLERIKLTIHGGITRACLLLLGRDQSTVLLNPYVAELSWKLEGPERGYEHFHPPFLLTTSRLFQRIRNLRLTFLPQDQLIPIEVSKYDERIVLEALHNCIAHQDYNCGARVLVIERIGELEFQNAGEFFDGTPDDYVRGNRSPRRYRNRLLTEAMVMLNMIDRMGFGIREVMWKGQASRYLPLPDFDLSESGYVKLRIQGRLIDENYSRALLANPDFSLSEILALDRIQKGASPDEGTLSALRKRGLIEGRKPNLHISASVAAATNQRAAYIRSRRQDDAHYRKLVLDYLKQWEQASAQDIRALLIQKLPDVLSAAQKEHKIHNLLVAMRVAGLIVNIGGRRYPIWKSSKS